MRYVITNLIVLFLLGTFGGGLVYGAEPVSKEKKPTLTVDVQLSPTPITPSPTPLPETTPVPSKPVPSPTVALTPTVMPTAVPTSVPYTPPKQETKQEEKQIVKKIEESVKGIMSQVEDKPTPTPTPEAVEVLQNIISNDPPKDSPPPASPVKRIQQFIAPSASFFLRSVPGNYYLINSLTRTESAGLLVMALLLMACGTLLLYKTQKAEIMRALEAYIATYVLPLWTRNKQIITTIFDRDYAK